MSYEQDKTRLIAEFKNELASIRASYGLSEKPQPAKPAKDKAAKAADPQPVKASGPRH